MREPADHDELLARLGDASDALVRARDDHQLLAALAPRFAPRRPDLLVLERPRHDPTTDADDLVPVARWPADADELARLPHTHELPLVHRAREHGRLTLAWRDAPPREPGEPELDALLSRLLAGELAARDALAEHTRELDELAALQRLGDRVAGSTDPVDLLSVLVTVAPGPAPQAKLLELRCDAAGRPETITVIAVHGGDPGLPTNLGVPVEVDDTSTAHVWLDSPNTPVLLSDMRDTSHEGVRAGHERSKLVAAVLIPLRWQGRWVGLFQLGWTEPRSFSAAERRLYRALGPLLAVMLDNRMLTRRDEQLLAERRTQARTLEIVLDHLPVGVQIHDPATGLRRLNRAAQELLRAHAPDDVRPLPLYHPDSDERVSPDERLSRMAVARDEQLARQRDLLEPDGTRRRLSVTAAPIRDERGRPTGAVTLFHDITARVAAERARAELRQAVLAAQRAALRERSTPLIPIDDEVLVLPLIGAIDPERGRQIVDTLAALVGHEGARVVLIDLTGVRELDEPGARAILEGAAVLRLRGARPILTGIGHDVAWALASLDLDLRGIPTHKTLQSGLAAARRA